jgi:hypothetical protein
LENLDVARVILQRKLESDDCGEEEKAMLIKQKAFVHGRLGTCLAWTDQFKEAVKEYHNSLELKEQIMNPERSRDIAQTY